MNFIKFYENNDKNINIKINDTDYDIVILDSIHLKFKLSNTDKWAIPLHIRQLSNEMTDQLKKKGIIINNSFVTEDKQHDLMFSKLKDKLDEISKLVSISDDNELKTDLNYIVSLLKKKEQEYSETDIDLANAIQDLEINIGSNENDYAKKLKDLIKNILKKDEK
jgi:GTPase involved in cell partitioning and DNA repair